MSPRRRRASSASTRCSRGSTASPAYRSRFAVMIWCRSGRRRMRVDNAARHDSAIGGRDNHRRVLVADYLARLDDGLEQVADAEAPRGERQIRSLGAALVIEAMAGKAQGFAEQAPAAVEITPGQPF